MLNDLSGTTLEKRTRAATDSQLRKPAQNSHHTGNMEPRAASSILCLRGSLGAQTEGDQPSLLTGVAQSQDVFLSIARPLLAVLCQQRRR